jgi:hypothetical protein
MTWTLERIMAGRGHTVEHELSNYGGALYYLRNVRSATAEGLRRHPEKSALTMANLKSVIWYRSLTPYPQCTRSRI